MAADKEYMKQAKRISRIRKKDPKSRTQIEKALLADWESKRKKSGRPQVTASTPGGPPVAPDSNEASVSVQTELPGSAKGGATLPPLDVDLGNSGVSSDAEGAGEAASSAQEKANGQSSASAAQNTSHPPKHPAMSADEAAAQGKMVADIATSILATVNKANGEAGAQTLSDDLIKLFHFSVSRMSVRYGAAIDEETYDGVVICGAAGFVGFQSWKISKAKKKAMQEEGSNVVGHPATPNPQSTPVPQPAPVPRQQVALERQQPRFEGTTKGIY
jgi:hypothetical protein